ncbi:hypothetical protein SAMN04487931_11461 [Desulfobacula phenolica]|uniref:Uncharacterized protein n=1 Tax=Desulfobacula phenolica TaxID=90732 RepID=A0A1H2JQP3_9BACT|nr:hypothetical protein SAMN04487931_11461 [Desulfobacula phenolica]
MEANSKRIIAGYFESAEGKEGMLPTNEGLVTVLRHAARH